MDLRLDLPFCIGFCSLRHQQKAVHLIAKPYEGRFSPQLGRYSSNFSVLLSSLLFAKPEPKRNEAGRSFLPLVRGGDGGESNSSLVILELTF